MSFLVRSVRYVGTKLGLPQRAQERRGAREPLLAKGLPDEEAGAPARTNMHGANGEQARLELDDHFSYTTDIGCQFIFILFSLWVIFLKGSVASKLEKCLVIFCISIYILTVQSGAIILNKKDDRKEEGDWAFIVGSGHIVLTVVMTVFACLAVYFSS